MSLFKDLKPDMIWKYFEEICQIPRPSKKEDKIIDYLIAFAKKYALELNRDKTGNVVIRKPATKGFENKKTAVLQSHVDMVCEKNSDSAHQFDTDPIQAYIDQEWVKAKGTTLGADDGIGVAAALAILSATNIQHGPLECLFTVGEEIGLIGAFALEDGFFGGDILINLDSEDEGELFIGCAGGIDTVATFHFKRKEVPVKTIAYQISISGLQGGHSGDDIHKGLGNANKILNRFLWNVSYNFAVRLAHFDGGNLRNAIAREAFAIVTVKEKERIDFIQYFNQYSEQVKKELEQIEPALTLTCNEAPKPLYVINKKAQFNLINSLYACPHGVIAMSKSIPGLVETSTNLASVKFKDDERIEICTSQRSSVNSSKFDISTMVESAFLLANADIWHSAGYPGWSPNTNSQIMKITKDSYIKLFGEEPQVKAIHAGLECGLFLTKNESLDMISFGPTIKGAHSPDERLHIASVQKFWDLLIDVLQQIPEK